MASNPFQGGASDDLFDLEQEFARLERNQVQSINFTKFAALHQPPPVEPIAIENELTGIIRNVGQLILRIANLSPNRFIFMPIPEYKALLRERAASALAAVNSYESSSIESIKHMVSTIEDYVSHAVESSLRAQMELGHAFNPNNHAATIGLRLRALLQRPDAESLASLRRSLGRLALGVEQVQDIPDVLASLLTEAPLPLPAPVRPKHELGNLRVAELEHTGQQRPALTHCTVCATPLEQFVSYYREDGEAYCGWPCRQKAIQLVEEANAARRALDAKIRAIPANRLTYTPEKMTARLLENPNFLFEAVPGPVEPAQAQPTTGSRRPQSPPAPQPHKVPPQSTSAEDLFLKKLDMAYNQLTAARQSHAAAAASAAHCPTCDKTLTVQPPFECIGQIAKQGGKVKTWKIRWLVLRGPHLFYYESRGDVGTRAPLGLIHIGALSTHSAQQTAAPDKWKNKAAWSFRTPTREFLFVCETETERRQWLDCVVEQQRNLTL